LVAKRIVDKQVLRLIRMWLKAPIVEEREDGKKEYKRNEKGTPQGGIISPLLANIYLNVLDTRCGRSRRYRRDWGQGW
jgi:RNA-directed DNA polymerase